MWEFVVQTVYGDIRYTSLFEAVEVYLKNKCYGNIKIGTGIIAVNPVLEDGYIELEVFIHPLEIRAEVWRKNENGHFYLYNVGILKLRFCIDSR